MSFFHDLIWPWNRQCCMRRNSGELYLNTAGSKVPAIWAIYLMVMCNSACTFQGHSAFYVPFPYTPFSYKEFFTVAGITYFRFNNLITSLQLSQAIWSMSFKRSNGRIILMAAFLGDSTPLSGGLSLCILHLSAPPMAFSIHRCYFNEMCLVFKYMKCLCMYILCWNPA